MKLVPVNCFEYGAIKALAILWFVGTLGVFLFYAPYWALMDDHGHVYLAATHFGGMNLFEYVQNFLANDFHWGMFRPMYAIFIYLFYGTLHSSSALAYLILYFVNIMIFWIWAILFERSLRHFLGAKPTDDLKIYRWLFFIFCFLFSPNYTLLFFASLQERLVLLFASVSFLAMLQISNDGKASVQSSLFLFSGLLASLLSKASGIFLIPVLVLWLFLIWLKERKKSLLILILLLMAALIGFGSLFLSVRGGYTESYQFANLINRFFNSGRRFFTPFWFAWATLGSIFLYWRAFDRSRSISQVASLLVWPAALLCYLLVMLPWRAIINYYLIVPGGMFWTGCKVMLLFFAVFLTHKWKPLPVFLLIALVCLGVSISCIKKFRDTAMQHRVTGDVVSFLNKEFNGVSSDSLFIRMSPPCFEASDAVSSFLGRPGLIRIYDPNELSKLESDSGTRKLFIVNGECEDIPASFSSSKAIFKQDPWAVYEKIK